MKNSNKLICENLTIENGNLFFAGHNTNDLAQKYKTPLYLMDEQRIRNRCRTYIDALNRAFNGNCKALYASKAASFKRLYEIMKEEGMGIDVVSSGEIRTALAAKFPLENAFFHSNNKTDEDIAYAIENGIGYFVADNSEELYAIDREASKKGIKQKVLLRITPGIDPHTYAAIATGKVDSKFGSAIETGQAKEITALALTFQNIDLAGFHCHVGSQIFDSDVYLRSSRVMLEFIAQMKNELSYTAKILDLGGGYGVRYIEDQPTIDIASNIEQVGVHMRKIADELGICLPTICFEPGRSIVADAGLTLYTVGTIKRIPGYKSYVSVDGGMTDNLRYALYGAPYTLLPCGKMDEEFNEEFSVVGRCCESGDILQEKVALPHSMQRGDILACLTTGAYHYSMSSNYNRIPRPPVVMINKKESYLAVRRETVDDLVSLDI